MSLVSHVGGGFKEFCQTTRAELAGEVDTRGEGVRTLGAALVAGAFGSASKVSGSIANFFRNQTESSLEPGLIEEEAEDYCVGIHASLGPALLEGGHGGDINLDTRSIVNCKENELVDMLDTCGASRANEAVINGKLLAGLRTELSVQEPRRAKSIINEGADYFVQSLVTGLSGVVEEPEKGMMSTGIVGALTGTCRGVLGLVTAPVAGVFGAVSVMAKEVESSAKFRRGKPVGRRRRPRSGPHSILFENYDSRAYSFNNIALVSSRTYWRPWTAEGERSQLTASNVVMNGGKVRESAIPCLEGVVRGDIGDSKSLISPPLGAKSEAVESKVNGECRFHRLEEEVDSSSAGRCGTFDSNCTIRSPIARPTTSPLGHYLFPDLQP